MRKKRRGFITGIVLVIFVLSIFIMALVYRYSSSNLSMTRYQMERTEAVYLAKSGAVLGLSAAFTEDSSGKTLFEEYSIGKSNKIFNQALSEDKVRELIKGAKKDASLWIRIERATDEENKKLSDDVKYLKITAHAVVGRRLDIGNEAGTDEKVSKADTFLFINLKEPADMIYVDPLEGTWDAVNWNTGEKL